LGERAAARGEGAGGKSADSELPPVESRFHRFLRYFAPKSHRKPINCSRSVLSTAANPKAGRYSDEGHLLARAASAISGHAELANGNNFKRVTARSIHLR
jgi:hypothetical protein